MKELEELDITTLPTGEPTADAIEVEHPGGFLYCLDPKKVGAYLECYHATQTLTEGICLEPNTSKIPLERVTQVFKTSLKCTIESPGGIFRTVHRIMYGPTIK